MGTSRGTISAANAGIRLSGTLVAGVVLTASVTEPGGRRRGTLFDVPLSNMRKAVLIAHHRQDGCRVSPPSGVDKILSRLPRGPLRTKLLFAGGRPARSPPCRGKSPHGFYGIEDRVVGAIIGWMNARIGG